MVCNWGLSAYQSGESDHPSAPERVFALTMDASINTLNLQRIDTKGTSGVSSNGVAVVEMALSPLPPA